MEGFKDVIVSQPPAMYAQSSYTANISLENYKGILLCDRPTNIGSVGGGFGGEGASSFVPGGPTGNPLGLGPTAESRALRERHQEQRANNVRHHRNQSQQVLSRHRRWLHSFAQQMKRMKQADVEQQVEAAHRAARLRKAEQERREQLQQQSPTTPAEMPTPHDVQKLDPFSRQRAAAGEGSSAKKSNKGKSKPRWAMTEDEALDDELGMNDDLLDFAKNLDYDKFINDCEVTEALTVMRDRVAQIAKANHWSEDDIMRAAGSDDDDDLQSVTPSELASGVPRDGRRDPARAALARQAAPGGAADHDGEWDGSVGRGRLLKRAISQDALALAERLLANSPSMQKIYTKHSLARALQKCALTGDTAVTEAALQERRAAQLARMGPEELTAATALNTAVPVPEPKVVQVRADASPLLDAGDGGGQTRILREMQMSKERTQGLPYLYRCPAI